MHILSKQYIAEIYSFLFQLFVHHFKTSEIVRLFGFILYYIMTLLHVTTVTTYFDIIVKTKANFTYWFTLLILINKKNINVYGLYIFF